MNQSGIIITLDLPITMILRPGISSDNYLAGAIFVFYFYQNILKYSVRININVCNSCQ